MMKKTLPYEQVLQLIERQKDEELVFFLSGAW
jgi:hypothetical protein